MDFTLDCLKPTVLAELLEGGIEEPALSELTRHLENCQACQSAAKTLERKNRLVETLRGDGIGVDRSLDPTPAVLIDRIKLIPQLDSGAGVERAFDAEEFAADQLDEIRRLLEPAQQVGEIGRLGHYRILEVLGRGGMGAVFLAEDPKLDRRVALKMMLPKIANIPAARDRFLREAKAAARLKNDHIVTIYQVDAINDVPFLAMELLEGESLEQSIQASRRFSAAESIGIARDIAMGLADAHEKGLIHRDIKPGNLWLERTPDVGLRVKILDFGLARAAVDDVKITEYGLIVGTPAFMAPEQARADRPIDGRADLFSLGAVMYLLCTGEIPFKADTTVGTLMALALNTPVEPSRCNESVPVELSQFVMQLLEKDASNRPQSAREVVERLTEIDRSLTSGDADTAISRRAIAHRSQPDASENRLMERTQPMRGAIGRGLKIATAFLIMGSLLIAAGIFFWQAPDGRIVRIECNDSSIMLAIQGGELKVTGAYDQPVTLTPGKIDLKVTKPQPDGKTFEFETDHLVVRKGDRIALKIEMLDGEIRIVQEGKGVVDSRSLPSTTHLSFESIADSDRRAAMWVLSVGGNITIEGFMAGGNESSDGIPRVIRTIAALPNEPFALTAVKCQNIEPFDGAGFIHLRDLKYLHTLVVEGEFERVTDAAFENLRGCTRLTHLGISGCSISDKALEPLKELPALAFLGISGKPGLTDIAMESIQRFPALTKLYLNGANLTDNGVRHLSSFKNLQSLGLGGCEGITDRGLWHIADIKTITTLDLAATSAGDGTMKRLSALPNLTDLSISYAPVSDQGLEYLQTCKGLKLVWAMYTSVTVDAVERLHAAVPECRIEFGTDSEPIVFDVNGMTNSKPLPSGAEQFASVIEAMKLANPGFDGAMIPGLENGRLVGLDFKTENVTDLGPLRELKHLRGLRMVGNSSPERGISDLSPLRGLQLTGLYIYDSPRVSDLSPIKGMPLQELHANGCPISDFSPLAGMPLRILWAWSWNGSDLSPLKGLPLTQLNIGGNGKAMDLTPLAGAPLEFLCCNVSDVSDLTPLRNMPLKRLMCENTLVSDLSPIAGAKLQEFMAAGSRIADFTVLREMPLQWAKFDIVPERDLEILRQITSLVRINDQRASDFLRELSSEVKDSSIPVPFTNTIGMEFVRVPKGKAWLVRRESEERLMQKYETTIEEDFYLGTYEVTQEEWSKVMGSNPSWFTRNAEGTKEVKVLPDDVLKRLPVERVSWLDCQEFLKRLNKMDKQPNWTYRLPTEAEWQYGCRGGPMKDASEAELEYHASLPGQVLSADQANFAHELGWKRPCRVGMFPTNKLGLFDMHGNVGEWCDDKAEWLRTESRLLHAGSWSDSAVGCRTSRIEAPTESWTSYDLGLRVARVPVKN